MALREKYPNTEFFLVHIFLYLVRIQENTDQKKLRIWTLYAQCGLKKAMCRLTATCSNSAIETPEKEVKYAKS